MKVLENSPHRLKLQHRPLSEWIGGGVLAAVSGGWLVMGLLFQPVFVRLSCDRPTPTQTNCELTQRAILRPLGKQRLFDLQSAEVETRRTRRGSYKQVQLMTPYGEKDLLSGGGTPDSRAIATQINQYIQNPQQKVLVVQQNSIPGSTLVYLLGIAAFAGGIWLTLIPVVTSSFYERLNKVMIERQRWHGRKQMAEYALSSIMTAELEEKQGKRGKTYRPVLVLDSTERVPITDIFLNEKTAHTVVDSIQKFLSGKR